MAINVEGFPFVWTDPEIPDTNISAQQINVGADNPRPVTPMDVHTVHVSVAVPTEREPQEVHSVRVQIAVRADHKPDGSRYSLAATPGAEDTQVIYHDLFFPKCFSYGSTGSPKYTTEKVEVDSGAEQRNQRRMYPRHEYNIDIENMPAHEVAEIMNLWHVCAGDHTGFMFFDPMDHTSANNAGAIGGTEIAATDQFQAAAVGSQTDYILYKWYKANNHEAKRRIRYPDLDTLIVAVDGVEIASWEYDLEQCVLRFLQPVATLTATMSRSSGGAITGANFSALKPGDLVYITGWSNAAYNATPGSDPARVVSADATTLVLQKYNGTAYGAAVFTGETVTVQSALPPTGSEITAGFYFYVPVRFEDGDNMEHEIKAGLRESAVVDFNSITLREIFE